MEEERRLKLIKNENSSSNISQNEIGSYDIDYDILANKVASKVNTQMLNVELKKCTDKIDLLNNGITNLINEFKKQTVDENNSSFKIARMNEKADFTINSMDVHITHVISLTHIAECYHLVTDKDDKKFSVNKARQMVMDLNLLEDNHYAAKVLNGSKSTTKKYHHSILCEIKNRLLNPTKYDIPSEISEKWRRLALVPQDNEIKAKIEQVFSLLQ